jgi:microcystin-dependent protein
MIKQFSRNRREYASAHFVGQIRSTSVAITGAGEVIARPGWLYANGAAVSRATYAKLFARIGTTYGVGDGSTTFNLPDYRGRIPSCALDGQAAGGNRMAATAGLVAGEETHALVVGEIPRHFHGPGTLAINGGSHTHTSSSLSVSGNNSTGTNSGTVCCAWQSGQTGFTMNISGSSAAATHTHPAADISGQSGNGSSDGLAGTAHSNVPPVQGCCKMVAYE